MIWIILSWIYITVVSFLIGCLFTGVTRRIFKVQARERLHFSFICINGFLFTSFIISAWLLFYKVDLLANIFILVLALSALFFNKKEIAGLIKIYVEDVRKTSKAIWVFFTLFVFVMAYISYMPSSHADDSGCFSPVIKWIQEYGAVPGIANLDARLGYNSTWFDLQALFGFAFLKAGLFNDLNGLLFLYILLYSFHSIDRLLKGESSFMNYFRALFFLPVLFIYFGFSHDIMLYSIQFFTSPTYHIPVTFILWMLFFLFLELKDLKAPFSASVRPYLIIFYSAWLVTVKLNAAPVVIVALFLLAMLFREKKYRSALAATGLCFLIAVPWIAKTVISCGYLFFPFVELDILNVDWKLTPRAVLYIESSVMTWAIDPNVFGSTTLLNDKGHFSAAISDWFPVWFHQLNYINTIIFFMMIISGFSWLVIGVVDFLKNKRNFFREHAIAIVVALTILVGLLLWLAKGPAPRYGYGYLLFLAMLSVSRVIYFFINGYHSRYAGIAMLAFIIYALVYYGMRIQEPLAQSFFKKAPPIVSPEYSTDQLGDGKFIHVVKEPACGNAPLPSSPKYVYEFLRPAFRGKTVKEGFVNQRPAEEYRIE